MRAAEIHRRKPSRRAVLGGIASALCASAVRAAPAPYRWNSLTIITSTGAGGTYDLIARLVARYMPKYLPGNPTAIVQNMPGGGNVVATNYMYNNALKDGTFIAVINDAIPLHQVIDGRGVRFDADKFNWLGSPGDRNSVTFAWHATGIRTIEDVMQREIALGGTGVGSSIVIYPTAMNKVLGTKFKIVLGYRSSAEVFLAMERGEIGARSVGLTSVLAEYPDWITEKKINFLFQVGARRDPMLPDVPLLTELARTEEQRQILGLISSPTLLGQPYLAPPGTPADRVAILRTALASVMREPAFIADLKKFSYQAMPLSGEDVARYVHQTVAAPPDVVAKARAIIASAG
jgi:tripartite-type tricarboxylate transporter receptor subunit TctC